MKTLTGLIALVFLPFAPFAQSIETVPKFAVADVHKSRLATNPYTFLSGGVLRGARYDLRKATMLDLIRIAYGIEADTIYGGPNWLELDRFDIAAKAPPSTPPETVALMLRSLLEDRFKLVLHNDTKPVPAFALSAGRSKHKMKPAGGSGYPDCQYQPQTASGYTIASCRNMTMDLFAKQLRGMAWDYLPNLVVNSTGIDGAWDFDLKWSPRPQGAPGNAERISIFDAVDQQLGLTLGLQNIPTPVTVVDHVNENPTNNPPGVAELLPAREVEFEVADVKPSRPDEQRSFGVTPGGGLEARGIELKILISTAWDVDWDHANELIAGIPSWADSAPFDINAKAPTAGNGPPPRGTGFIDDEARLMLRNLLIDRFKLKTHVEERLVNAYTLVAAKPKLRKGDPSNRAHCKEAPVVEKDPRDLNPRLSRLVACENITMPQFAAQLQKIAADYIPYEVEDATGLAGAWEFTLNFTPSYQLRNLGNAGAAGLAAQDPNGGLSLFDAMAKQLGLKLEMRKRMIPVVVIDHIEEKPTEN
jgi:uncharacterized protein (TIGR03435 family)